MATHGLIADWDVSCISDMSYLFAKLNTFNAKLSNWDTSRVTDMSGMFKVRAASTWRLEAPRTPIEHAPHTESSPAQSPPISAPSFPITYPEPGVDS